MPTPFSHLYIAQKLLEDSALPPPYRQLLQRQRPAFLLGSVVADARVASGMGRHVTHFYAYNEPISERSWRRMLRCHPSLQLAQSAAHRAFLAGYVAHLACDEAWALKMARPHFWRADWPGISRYEKFFCLHLLLCFMDERDERALAAWQAAELQSCQPGDWLPFLPQSALLRWQDYVAQQIAPNGSSRTLDIFSRRLGCEPQDLRTVLDEAFAMQIRLWHHIPKALLAEVERQAYAFALEQMARYLGEYEPQDTLYA